MKRTVLLGLITAMLCAAPAQAEITAIYPKKVCYQTSSSQLKKGGVIDKTLFWGVVAFRWCQRISDDKHHGDVVNYSGPVVGAGVTGHGKWWSWEFEGVSRNTVKCISRHAGGICSYLRLKVWLEFERHRSIWDPRSNPEHRMRFSLLVGNGVEDWR